MRRAGAILIPLLTGFLLTVAVVSWRAGGWQPRAATAPPPEVRPPSLRIVEVNVAAASARAAAASPAPAPAAPQALPQPAPDTSAPLPIPRVDTGNSAELLEAPERKFARGSDSSGN